MPRQYKRKPGSRKYNDYDPENLEKALEKVVSGWPLNKAAKTKIKDMDIPLRGPPTKKSRLTVAPGKGVNAAPNESSENSDNDIGVEPLMESDDKPADNDDPSGEVDYLDVSASDLKQRCFLLVRIKSGKRSSMAYKYACVVQEKLENGDCRVMGLASADEEKKTFKVVEQDIFEVPSDDIIAVLPEQ